MLEDLFTKLDGHLRDVVPTMIPKPVRVVDIPLVIGTNGIAIAVDDHVFFRLGLNGVVRIISWSLAVTVAGVATSGAITIDVQAGSTLATVASICGGSEPELTAQSELSDQSPSGWTVEIPDPQWLMAIVTAADGTLEVASLTLRALVIPRAN